MVDPIQALSVFVLLALVSAAVLWPRRGLLARLRERARLTERVRMEDALKHVYSCEAEGRPCTLESLAGRLGVSRSHAARLLRALEEMGQVRLDADGPRTTDEGRDAALRLIRTHRLWERYLADRTGVPPTEWHAEAERVEHTLSDEEVARLASRLGHPRWDPHGDPIPTETGELPEDDSVSLNTVAGGRAVEVTHLEDEPREIYEGLLEQGLAPGDTYEVVAGREPGTVLRGGGREVRLDALQARNVSVRVLPEGEAVPEGAETLADLRVGEEARVVGLSPACQGPQRRRLLDLGVVPGTRIRAELVAAAGDPVAYRIRGALIALRREQARWVFIERAVGVEGSEPATAEEAAS